MQPIYFGNSDKPLFGIYYLPQANHLSSVGIVLCYPIGQEYLWMHRAYRQLANLFTRAGFHVLRFDYYGCGDSWGEGEEGSIPQWLNDITMAIEELKDASGVNRVSLVGFRLGATLSVLAGSERNDVDSMVLWEPVVYGKDYIKELKVLHEEWVENNLPDPNFAHQTESEIVGFPLTWNLLHNLEIINLLNVESPLANSVCIIESKKTTSNQEFFQLLKKFVPRVDFKHIPGSKEWIKSAGLNPISIPNQILQSIVSWVSEVSL